MSLNEGRRQTRAPLPRMIRGSVRRMVPGNTRKPSRSTYRPGLGVVDWALYTDGRKVEIDSLEQAHERAATSARSFVWIGLHQPTESQFGEVANLLGLHPLAVEDAVHAHQRPKVEVYQDSIFVVLKTARYVDSNEVVDLGELMMFVSSTFVVSVRHGVASALADVRQELESREDILANGPSAVLWAAADRVVDDYKLAIDGLASDVEQIETEVFNPQMADPSERIYKLKREMLEFRRAIDQLSSALEDFEDGTVPMISSYVRPYFRDVRDHVLRDAARLSAFDELLTNVLQANVARVTLRQSEDSRRITAWAAILAANTTIAGVYGMNFENMPELGWHYGYYMALGAMVGVSVLLFVSFKRRKWL